MLVNLRMNSSPTATVTADRARWVARGGWLIILLGAGAALLPEIGGRNGTLLIGALLIASGMVEISAGSLRRETHSLAMAAGGVTLIAGLLFLTKPATHFLSAVTIIAGWLFVRSIMLGLRARLEQGRVRTWVALSAIVDMALALVLAAGLSIATLVVTLFGATPPLVASFAWVLALSFAVNGLMLLRVASAARGDAEN